MPARELPKKFAAPDGVTFASKAEAESHEQLMDAEHAYRRARLVYCKALAERNQTADGHPFKLSISHTYFRVTERWDLLPGVERMSFWLHHCDLDDDDNCVIRYKDSSTGKWDSYRIDRLYSRQDAADRACLEAQRERLAALAEDVDKLAERVEPTEASND